MKDFVVILFYKFTHISDPKAFAQAQRAECEKLGLTGRMLIAEEGINGTFEGTREAIDIYKAFLKSDHLFADILIKESKGNGKGFSKLKIKVRDEVVTLGAGKFDIKKETATELSPTELEKWYANNEDFIVLDLRNDYEIVSGKFDKTIDPGLSNFRDLPKKLKELEGIKNKKVVAVCTGGIRCEKATCLLKKEGFSDLYQLKDGIHTYMQEYPNSHFKGSLFVFDNRMTTDVVDAPGKVVIGRCTFCEVPSEKYYSDDSVRPSKKVIVCENCFKANPRNLREVVSVL